MAAVYRQKRVTNTDLNRQLEIPESLGTFIIMNGLVNANNQVLLITMGMNNTEIQNNVEIRARPGGGDYRFYIRQSVWHPIIAGRDLMVGDQLRFTLVNQNAEHPHGALRLTAHRGAQHLW